MSDIDNIELRSEEVQEILGHIPNKIIRYGITVILSIILLVFIGSFFFKYPDILPAPVEILSENPPITVVAKSSGNLAHIFVADSQYVKKNEILGEIKNPAKLKHILYLKQLVGKFDNITSFNWLSIMPDTLSLGDIQNSYSSFYKVSKEYLQFEEINHLPQKIASLKSKKAQLEKYSRLMKKQSLLKEQDYALAEKKYQRDSILYKKDVISLSDLEKGKKDLLQNRLSFESTLSTEVTTQIQIQDLQRQIFDLQNEQIKQAQNFQNQLLELLNNLKSRLAWWYNTYLLVSPIEGIVAFNNVWSSNQFIKTGDDVFTILPNKQTAIIGRAILPVKGAGKVKPGQKVNIKFDNYPYQEFGMLTAEVSSISRVPSKENYIVEISLPDTLVTNYGYLLPFSQKMSGTAEIITEDLPLIVRLFNPLKAILKKHLGASNENVVRLEKRTTKKQKPKKEEPQNKQNRQIQNSTLQAAVLPKDLLPQKNIKNDTIKQKKTVHKYHIIAGSFINKTVAQKAVLRFEQLGYSCVILESNNGRYRLSIYASITKHDALTELKRIKQQENIDGIWVLRE